MKRKNLLFIFASLMALLLIPSKIYAMDIFVDTPSGNRIELEDVESTDSILNIKEEIFENEEIPTNIQVLLYNGTTLENSQTLADYNIQNNDIINLQLPIFIVGDEILDNTTKANTSNTAIYDDNNNTLTLNGYNDGKIQYYGDKDIAIILKNNNTISTNQEYSGIKAWSNLTITGDGNLTIDNIINGISISYGDLKLDNANITIKNIDSNGISIEEGNLLTNSGNIKILDAYDSGIMIHSLDNTGNFGNATINGDLSIISTNIFPDAAIYTTYNTIINGGNITMNAALYTMNSDAVIINGGNITATSHLFGIVSFKKFIINSGYLKVSTPNEGQSVAFLISSSDINAIEIGNNMEIIPNDLSIQKVIVTPENLEVMTIGKEGASATMGRSIFDVTTTNVASEVIFQEKFIPIPPTGDNISIYIITGLISLISIITFLYLNKKEKYRFN